MTWYIAVGQNLVAAAVGAAVMAGAQKVRSLMFHRAVKAFFVESARTTLIVHPNMGSTHYGVRPYSDAVLVRRIAAVLERAGMREGQHFSIHSCADVIAEDGSLAPVAKESNLILVGGPKSNRVTEQVLDMTIKSPSQFGFFDTPTGVVIRRDEIEFRAWADRPDPKPTSKYDHGLIMTAPNPFSGGNETTVTVLAGIHEIGTLGLSYCVYYSMSGLLRAKRRAMASDPCFQEIVTIEYNETWMDIVKVKSSLDPRRVYWARR